MAIIDYNDLKNKPSLDGTELKGDVRLDLANKEYVDAKTGEITKAIIDKLTKIADAIRKKTGIERKIQIGEMPDLILNINGGLPPPEEYSGAYEITPSFEFQELETKDKLLLEDINVLPITVIETSNQSNGNTLII